MFKRILSWRGRQLLKRELPSDTDKFWNTESDFFETLATLDGWVPDWREHESKEDRLDRVRLILTRHHIYTFQSLEAQFIAGNFDNKLDVVFAETSLPEDFLWLMQNHPEKFIQWTVSDNSITRVDVLRAFQFNGLEVPGSFARETWGVVHRDLKGSVDMLMSLLRHHALQLSPPDFLATTMKSMLDNWDKLPKETANFDSYDSSEFWAPTVESWNTNHRACLWAFEEQIRLYAGEDS
ncbi:MAG: hypothetical protein RJQ07_14295 [Pseudomonadales bacterium]